MNIDRIDITAKGAKYSFPNPVVMDEKSHGEPIWKDTHTGNVLYPDRGDEQTHFVSAGDGRTYYMPINSIGVNALVKSGFLSPEQRDKMFSELRRADRPERREDPEEMKKHPDSQMPVEQRLFVLEAQKQEDGSLKATRAYSGTFTPRYDPEKSGGEHVPYLRIEETLDMSRKDATKQTLNKGGDWMRLRNLDPILGDMPTEQDASYFKSTMDGRLKEIAQRTSDPNLDMAVKAALDPAYTPATPADYQSPTPSVGRGKPQGTSIA